MRLNAKRFIHTPILGMVNKLLDQALNPNLVVSHPDPLSYKTRMVERVLSGGKRAANKRLSAIETDELGSEFWHGMYTTVNRDLVRFVIKHFSEDDPLLVIRSFNYLAFLKTSHKEEGVRSGDYWRRFIPLLRDREYQRVEQLVRELAGSNPNLFPKYVIEQIGVDEVAINQERNMRQIQIETAREAKDKAEREQSMQIKAEAVEQRRRGEKDPSLWNQLKPYAGKYIKVDPSKLDRIYQDKDFYVRVGGPRQRKVRGEDRYEDGFVLVSYYLNKDGQMKHLGNALRTYRSALGFITSPEDDFGLWSRE